jgi:hypothetical protein
LPSPQADGGPGTQGPVYPSPKVITMITVSARCLLLATAFAALAARMPAQSGQVEVWIPRTTRAVVVAALTERLTRDHWDAVNVSDYGVRFERRVGVGDPLSRPADGLTIDRLSVNFRDLADTLRVTGRLATVTNPNTATERIAWRDDPRAVQDVAEILATVKGVAQNRRPATDVAMITAAPIATPVQRTPVTVPPPRPSQVPAAAAPPVLGGSGEDVVYLKDGSIIHGTIVEQRPGASILVRTRDGNTMRYSMETIDRITKEPTPAEHPAALGIVAPTHKEPALSFVLSLLIVGGGQGYNGQWGKAAVMFGGAVIGADLFLSNYECYGYYGCSYNSTASIGALLLVGNVLWSVIDAPIAASGINRRAGAAFHPALVPLKSLGAKATLGIQVGRITF